MATPSHGVAPTRWSAPCPTRRRRADRFALTGAEQRVAELVAEGLSNRLIAERLAYSVKTIETYLSRMYAKTGCRNRVDLTRRFTATTV